ncbi:MAG: prepilin-type N-terminal cleavage/methylation domain-containing protein [Fibromonadales bacterium]|nr:prepilin-type N-terminal cleavage/methylation domain-containing protein [Fibromonadales bacterium]
MKKGFGLLEVMIAAVVLGFLIVGLNKLQMGNREALLRVRARDAANIIAQHVLDSLGSVGINSIQVNSACGTNLVYCKEKYTYNYEGNSGNIKTKIDYNVEVALVPNSEQKTEDKTNFDPSLSNVYAKSLKATVKWKFKNSDQKIEMAKVVR